MLNQILIILKHNPTYVFKSLWMFAGIIIASDSILEKLYQFIRLKTRYQFTRLKIHHQSQISLYLFFNIIQVIFELNLVLIKLIKD